MVAIIIFNGCQQCTKCRDVCYTCEKSQSPICSSDFPTWQSFDTIMAKIRASGTICKDTTEKAYQKICDDKQSLKKFIEIYEKKGLKCN